MAGTPPRAYCFPVLALLMLALVQGRPLAMASLVVVGALLYPASGVISGVALAIFLLVLPARDRGAAAEWALRRRLAVLAATALLAALAWLPVALRSRSYGPLIVPSQFAIFPEAGPNGRLSGRDDRPRGQGIAVEMRRATERSVSGSGPPLVPALHGWYERRGSGRWMTLVGLAIAGGIALARRRPGGAAGRGAARRGAGSCTSSPARPSPTSTFPSVISAIRCRSRSPSCCRRLPAR